MKRLLATMAAAVAAFGCLAAIGAALAAGPARDEPIRIVVQLGTEAGDHVMFPSVVTFQRDKRYTLVFENPSNAEHNVLVLPFAAAVNTTSRVAIERGQVTSRVIRRHRVRKFYEVREISVAPGGVAEWSFVPRRQIAARVGCTSPDHAAAGMTAEFEII